MTLKGKYVIKDFKSEKYTEIHYHTRGHTICSDRYSFQSYFQTILDEVYGPGVSQATLMYPDQAALFWQQSGPDEVPQLDEFYVSVPIFEYLECKNSVNTPYWGSQEVTDIAVVEAWHQRHAMRRPKKPVYFPLKIREPKFPKKPRDRSIIPVFRSPRPNEHEDRYQRYVTGVLRRINRVNERRKTRQLHKFKKLEALYWTKRARIAERRLSHKRIFERRLAKYEERYRRWSLLEEKSKDFSFKKANGKRQGYLTDNPYGFISLTPTDDRGLRKSFSWDVMRPTEEQRAASPFSREWFYSWETLSNNFWPTLHEDVLSGNLDERLENLRKSIIQACLPHIESDDDYLVRKTYDKIAAKDVHIGNMLAERHQTWELLAESVKRLRTLINLKKDILRTSLSAVRDPKWLSGEFLKFKFGAEPLANDIIELSKLVNDPAKDIGPVVAVRSNVKRHLSFNSDGIAFDGKLTLSRVYKFTTRDSNMRDLQTLGLINPGEIAWEVTPWSFVVDWFVPVGAWIEAHSSALGMQFLTGTRKIKLEGSISINGVPIRFDSEERPQGSNFESIGGNFICTVIDRKVETSLPDPNRIIRIKNPWSIAHGLESLALLIQRLKS